MNGQRIIIIGTGFMLAIVVVCQSFNLTEISIPKYYIRLVFDDNKISEIIYIDFKSFDQLSMYDGQLVKQRLRTSVSIKIIPENFMLLDSPVRLTFLRDIKHQIHVFNVFFLNLKAIVIQPGLFKLNSSTKHKITIRIMYSDFKLVHRNTRPRCDHNSIGHNETVFNTSRDLYLDARYYTDTCKYIFRNARLNRLEIVRISESFVRRNKLGFAGSVVGGSFDSRISLLVLSYAYRVQLNQRLIDPDIFQTIYSLEVSNDIVNIEAGLFRPLRNLKTIFFDLVNVRYLFGKGLTWLESINVDVKVNLTNLTDYLQHRDTSFFIQTFAPASLDDEYYAKFIYTYLEEDFCWFVKFPFESLLFLDIYHNCTNGCSCTKYWLLKHVKLLENFPNIRFYPYSKIKLPSTFVDYKSQSNECNFTHRVQLCQKPISPQSISSPWSIYDFVDEIERLDLVTFILTPVVSTLGLVTSIINLCVLSRIKLNPNTDEIKQRYMFELMRANSAINLAYCIIHLLMLMNKCVTENGVACSSLYKTWFGQYFKIVCVEFVGNILKTFSSLTMFGISLERYTLLEKDSKLAVFIEAKVKGASKKLKNFLLVMVSFLVISLNVDKLINYEQVDFNSTFKVRASPFSTVDFFINYPLFLADFISIKYRHSGTDLDSFRAHSRLYLTFYLLNTLLIEIVLFVLLTISDVLMLASLRRTIEEKKKVLKALSNSGVSLNSLNEIEQISQAATRVIIVNTFVLVVLKLASLVMEAFKYFISTKNYFLDTTRRLPPFCHSFKICLVYDDLLKIFYLAWLSYSLLLFYYLNRHFRQNFLSLFGKNVSKPNDKHTPKKITINEELNIITILSDFLTTRKKS